MENGTFWTSLPLANGRFWVLKNDTFGDAEMTRARPTLLQYTGWRNRDIFKSALFWSSCPWKLTILGLKSVCRLKWPHFELSRPSKCSILGLKSVCRLKMALFWPQLSFKMLDFVLKIEDRKSRNRKILGLQKSLTSQNGTILSSFALANARFWVSKNAWRLKMAPLWRSLPLENARFCGRNTTSQQSKPKELIVRSLKLGISRSLQAHDAESVMGLGWHRRHEMSLTPNWVFLGERKWGGRRESLCHRLPDHNLYSGLSGAS